MASQSLVETLSRDTQVKSKRLRHRKKVEPYKANDDEVLPDTVAKTLAKLQEEADLSGLSEDEAMKGEAPLIEDNEEGVELDLAAEMVTDENAPGYTTLADLIYEKIQKQERLQAEIDKKELFTDLTKKTYADVGHYLMRYRSGKLPKALKVVPLLKNWMEVLWLTSPDKWSPHAHAAVTPVFVHQLNDKQAQKYLRYVLLPAVEKHIDEHDHLNVHLYKALSASFFRASAFFTGIFLPAILSDSCNYKRATILCSVVSRESFSAIHAAAVIVKLTSYEPASPQIFYALIKMIQKKHDLPYPAIDALVKYFASDIDVGRSVIWHQLLLCFVQRWKAALTDAQSQTLHEVLRKHTHPKITKETRRELASVMT